MTAAALAASPPESDTVSSHIGRQLAIGREHYTAGRIDQAIEAFQSGLAAVESEAARLAAVDTVSELHSNLGNALVQGGKPQDAIAYYVQALT